jgi:UDP:flavonoid glycosyltransferase YjiC (YdhE family)
MSRFLFVFPPFVGHANPAIGVADALEANGHEVAWVFHRDVIGSMFRDDAKVYPAGDEFLHYILDHLPEREKLKGLSAVRFLWERVLVPLGLSMVDPVRAAVDDFGPDVIVSDQQAFAGALVAVERGLPWAVSACGTAELIDPVTLMPKVAAWFDAQIEGLCTALGVPELAAQGFDPRYSPHVVLQYSTRELVGEITRDVDSLAFVGPSLPEWAEATPFPWEWLDRYERRVLVSMGTLSQGTTVRFLGSLLEGVAGQDYGVILVGEEALLPPVPDNVLLMPFVPQLSLMPHLHAVVTHGGHNTVVGTLREGVPLVVAPIRDDQPIIAGQVAGSGAGIRVNFNRARAADIATAIGTVLSDPSYKAAAEKVATSFATAGGAPRAAELIESLVGQPGKIVVPGLHART